MANNDHPHFCDDDDALDLSSSLPKLQIGDSVNDFNPSVLWKWFIKSCNMLVVIFLSVSESHLHVLI